MNPARNIKVKIKTQRASSGCARVEGISQKWLVLFACSRIRGNPHMAVSYRMGVIFRVSGE